MRLAGRLVPGIVKLSGGSKMLKRNAWQVLLMRTELRPRASRECAHRVCTDPVFCSPVQSIPPDACCSQILNVLLEKRPICALCPNLRGLPAARLGRPLRRRPFAT